MVSIRRRGADGIYKNDRAQQRIEQQYRGFLDDIDTDLERRWIETPFGVTHLLVAGDEDDPPLFVFHGGNLVNPVTLEWFLPLADDYRIHAPDTIGHPGFSAQHRVSPYEDSYARWVESILNSLDIHATAMLGVSYGAGIVLRVATHAPERIDSASLVSPAGLGRSSLMSLGSTLFLPALRYRMFPTRDNLDAVASVLFSEPVEALDQAVLDHLGSVLRSVKLERRLPPAATAEELADLEASVLVAAGTEDVLFPPDIVLPRARETIPNLEVTMRLEGHKHIPGPTGRTKLLRYLRTFLADR